jgi:hypothetical protein
VKVVFGFEPSGLLEKIILAPEIGTPRTLPPLRAPDGESELEGPGSGLVGLGVASALGTFGTLIFGIVIVNCPIAGWVTNNPAAIAAIRKSEDDLVMKHSPQNVKCGCQTGNILA